MNIEEEFIKIIKNRKKFENDFKISQNSNHLEEIVYNKIKKNSKFEFFSYSNMDIWIKEYYLDNVLKNDIKNYLSSLIIYGGNLDDLKESLKYNNVSIKNLNKIKLSPLFKIEDENDFLFKIKINKSKNNIDNDSDITYNKIEKFIKNIPQNLIGIVKAKIENYKFNEKYYYGNPIIYLQN